MNLIISETKDYIVILNKSRLSIYEKSTCCKVNESLDLALSFDLTSYSNFLEELSNLLSCTIDCVELDENGKQIINFVTKNFGDKFYD